MKIHVLRAPAAAPDPANELKGLVELDSHIADLRAIGVRKRLKCIRALRAEVRAWRDRAVPHGSWFTVLRFWIGYTPVQMHLFRIFFALKFGVLEALEPDIRRRVQLIESIVH